MSALDKYMTTAVKPSQLNKPNFMVLYGAPGSGKTYLASSIALVDDYSPTLILDTENSTNGTVVGIEDDRITILPIKTHLEFNEVLNALLEDAEAGTLPYKSVIIDTLDVAQARAQEYFVAVEAAKDKPNTLAAFGETKKWTMKVGTLLRDAPFFAIAVMHSKRDKLEEGPLMEVVDLIGGSKDSFPGIPDIVGFTERQDNITTVKFGSSKRHSTKNRFQLPEQVEDPTMAEIIRLINKKEESN
jgi:energy-coupling factor transporter ATP-binding protein EcfA2